MSAAARERGAVPVAAAAPFETAGARVRGQVIDVAAMPSFAFSHRSLMWWGTAGVIAIEGTVFALAIFTYFFLWSHSSTWPLGAPVPDLRWGVVNTLILLASALPNHWTKRAAERLELSKVRIGLLVCLAFAAAFLVVRVLEFRTLNVRWDSSAYGSAVWMLMGLHTVHLLTDVFDTIVLTALMFTGLIEGKRYVDVSENALYWYFVVFAWLPVFATVYLAPRMQ
jgi:cytochrome c oxidase subunit I+III